MARFTDDRDGDYARRRLPMRVYVSRRWDYTPTDGEPEGFLGRAARFAYEVFDADQQSRFVSENGIEIVLRETPTRQQVRAAFFEDDRGVPRVTLQRFGPTGTPHKDEMSFVGSEVTLLREFLELLETVPLPDEESARYSEAAVRQALADSDTRRMLYDNNRELLVELIEQDINVRDVVAIAHRKRVLEEFQRRLTDEDYFDGIADPLGGAESAWQVFFEKHQWLLGMNLTLQFLHSWDPDRLESVIYGHSVAGAGKRVDALLVSAGLMRSVCLVEIKSHRTTLLRSKPYRPEVWSASSELAGGIAQCQAAAERARDNAGSVLRGTDADGAETGESALLVRPRTILVIGSLDEFKSDTSVNYKRYQAFDALRRTISDPIITYDELCERARLSLDLLQGRNP